MDDYKISHPYLGKEMNDGFLELEILSKNLNYGEIGMDHFGVQSNSCAPELDREIALKCREVADLIREIDKLTKDNKY